MKEISFIRTKQIKIASFDYSSSDFYLKDYFIELETIFENFLISESNSPLYIQADGVVMRSQKVALF